MTRTMMMHVRGRRRRIFESVDYIASFVFFRSNLCFFFCLLLKQNGVKKKSSIESDYIGRFRCRKDITYESIC